jgi:hypothetical protein
MSKQAWCRHLHLGVMSIGLVLVLVVGAVVAQALVGSKSGHANPDAVPTNNEYSVDADPATGGIQATIEVAVGSNFDVAWVISNTVDAWSAEQATMQWDPGIVSFVSGPVDTNLGGATICGGDTSVAGKLYWGCSVVAGDCGGACTGVTRTMTLHCDAPGTSALHLRTNSEEGEGTGTNFAITAGVGDPCETGHCHDAAVTCVSGAGLSPTPSTPTPPTPTPPTALPTMTPLPPGMEAVDLAAGCNPVASTYPGGTPIQTIAGNVGAAGILSSLWEFRAGTWLGYSPQFPEVSNLTELDFLDAVFICVSSPGAFVRPIV